MIAGRDWSRLGKKSLRPLNESPATQTEQRGPIHSVNPQADPASDIYQRLPPPEPLRPPPHPCRRQMTGRRGHTRSRVPSDDGRRPGRPLHGRRGPSKLRLLPRTGRSLRHDARRRYGTSFDVMRRTPGSAELPLWTNATLCLALVMATYSFAREISESMAARSPDLSHLPILAVGKIRT